MPSTLIPRAGPSWKIHPPRRLHRGRGHFNPSLTPKLATLPSLAWRRPARTWACRASPSHPLPAPRRRCRCWRRPHPLAPLAHTAPRPCILQLVIDAPRSAQSAAGVGVRRGWGPRGPGVGGDAAWQLARRSPGARARARAGGAAGAPLFAPTPRPPAPQPPPPQLRPPDTPHATARIARPPSRAPPDRHPRLRKPCWRSSGPRPSPR
jgi:hypothetical protein